MDAGYVRCVMNYMVRPKRKSSYGGVSMPAANARTALGLTKELLERGVEGVEVVDANGQLFCVVELEHLAEGEILQTMAQTHMVLR
jgi:hypothetical protein